MGLGGKGIVGGRRGDKEGHWKRLALMVAGNVNKWPVVTTCSRGGATREW